MQRENLPRREGGRTVILCALVDNQRPLSVDDLTDIAEVSRDTIRGTVQKLVASLLITAVDAPTGRKSRGKYFEITDLGRSYGPDFQNLPAITPPSDNPWERHGQSRVEIVAVLYRARRALAARQIAERTGASIRTINNTTSYGIQRGLVVVCEDPAPGSRKGTPAYRLTKAGRTTAKTFLAILDPPEHATSP